MKHVRPPFFLCMNMNTLKNETEKELLENAEQFNVLIQIELHVRISIGDKTF